MKAVLMPALGIAMTEGLVVRWLKQPGDSVVEGEPLLEIETDKSIVEVPSPATGLVGPLLFAEGDVVPCGVAVTHVSDGSADVGTPSISVTDPPPPPSSAVQVPPPQSGPAIAGGTRAPHTQSPRQRRLARELPAAVATEYLPIDLDGLDLGQLHDWLREMLLIRDFESRLDALSMSGKIPGGLHLSIGQEAVAVGIGTALQPQDLLGCAHRSHHHAIAKGLSTRAMMAELYGKATGCRGGRGGSMHLADQSLGFLGGNGIVGAGLGLAMGASLGAQVRSTDQIVVGIFGDGGANTGRTWESINIASVWKLPLIIVCENNVYAVETETALLTGGGSISRRAEGFGLPVRTVDGQDVAAMHRATSEARRRAAAGEGPTFIEALTYRYEGHSTGQVINYRTIDEVREWRDTRDPIQRLRLALDSKGALDDSDFEELLASVRAQVDDAITFAEESPLPDPLDATRQVTAMDLGLGNL